MSRFWVRGALYLACVFSASVPLGDAYSGSIDEFLVDQGCAVGPTTMLSATTAKIDPKIIEKLKAEANADDKTLKTGDWIVLSQDRCRIQPPMVISEIAVGDLEVVQNTSTITEHEEDRFKGCYLNGSSLFEALQTSRGWLPKKANQEYLRFLSAGLVSGDLSFFSPDPLRTPPGFMVTRGDCADVPQMLDVKKSHELLLQNFGALIRADAAGEATCESLGFPSWKFSEVSERILGGKAPNAWIGYEIRFIAMGAGWAEGLSSTQKGRPRPPLCRYAN
ncbi:hypothetical protein [uncultured Agrobacterium sp.]|uniref:hypothetical protein n=1 Tax=uncultured Agrobacterium sp. TaxID=157277 RepID=UPI0025830F18|nr:hypothetical protein [uncultured Agrobacterium sp.]